MVDLHHVQGLCRGIVSGFVVDQRGRVWLGGSRRAWEDFIGTASIAQLESVFLRMLELSPGARGEHLRRLYKIGGEGAVAEYLEQEEALEAMEGHTA